MLLLAAFYFVFIFFLLPSSVLGVSLIVPELRYEIVGKMMMRTGTGEGESSNLSQPASQQPRDSKDKGMLAFTFFSV